MGHILLVLTFDPCGPKIPAPSYQAPESEKIQAWSKMCVLHSLHREATAWPGPQEGGRDPLQPRPGQEPAP